MEKDNRYYRTSSFPLACFLFAKGQQIAGVNPTEEMSKKSFAFVNNSLHLEELIDKYKFGQEDDPDLMVSARVYEHTRKVLLDLLNS